MSESITTIGIVGGGQLGRMLTEAALPMGFRVAVVDPTLHSPAEQAGAHQIEASLKDAEAIRDLALLSDVVTWEIEHVNTDILTELAENGHDVQPSPTSLATINDKYDQKKHLATKHHLPVADFIGLDNEEDLAAAKGLFGDVVVKTRKGGFDGRGNLIPISQSWSDILEHFGVPQDNPMLYAEKVVPFEKELAVLVARDKLGRTAVYPVVETIQQEGICHTVIAPAPIYYKRADEAEDLGRAVVDTFEGAGVFAVEMFLDYNDNLTVNEVAPRVHNSGHLTIEANRTSQFQQHIRAITGLPLGSTELITPAAAMINILGRRNGPVELQGLNKVYELPDTHVHLYGKAPTKEARKMGHITVRASSTEEAHGLALDARARISI